MGLLQIAVTCPNNKGEAPMTRLIQSLLALSIALGFLLGSTFPASAHYVYQQGLTYISSLNCTETRSEISHGNGGGYSRADAKSLYVLQTTQGSFNCANVLSRPPGYLAAKWQLYKVVGSELHLCSQGSWSYNNVSTYSWYTYWYHGYAPPCGSGYYATYGAGFVNVNGTWYGGWIWARDHYLPA
jgi:hypothetical protein